MLATGGGELSTAAPMISARSHRCSNVNAIEKQHVRLPTFWKKALSGTLVVALVLQVLVLFEYTVWVFSAGKNRH